MEQIKTKVQLILQTTTTTNSVGRGLGKTNQEVGYIDLLALSYGIQTPHPTLWTRILLTFKKVTTLPGTASVGPLLHFRFGLGRNQTRDLLKELSSGTIF